MAYLILNGERFALQIGENTLGGAGDATVYLPPLEGLPALGAIVHWPGAEPTIRSLAPDVQLAVDDEPVGTTPRPLAHGARIHIAGLELVYGDLETSEVTTLNVSGVAAEQATLRAPIPHGTPTASTGGRLIELRSGRAFPVPEGGLVLGRDPECGIVLSTRDASRRHAVVKPAIFGYVVVNHSANGVCVNDARVDRQHVLAQGDVLRLAGAEFRFEADPASPERAEALNRLSSMAHRAPGAPTAASGAAKGAASSGAMPAQPPPVPDTPPRDVPLPPPPPRLLATLEVVTRGVLAGTMFRIDRLATSIGRAERSDVRLPDRSVSGAHATLILKDATWYVVDLESTNGTYVDGARVTGERALPGACTIRAGDIKMAFRPISTVDAADEAGATRRIVGVRG